LAEIGDFQLLQPGRGHYPEPPHRQPAYAAYHHQSFPVAEAFTQTCISLPIGLHLTLNQIDEVIELIQHFFK